jgi:hypothetical protein
MKTIVAQVTMVAALVACLGCETAPPQAPAQTARQAEKPAIPPEIEAAARGVLGSEAEVIVFGDLARTGTTQALVINRIYNTPSQPVPGTLFTRAAIISKEGDRWKELLRVDEHLKNPRGFLAATPVSPVNGWRLQYEQDPVKGIQLYFTPMHAPRGGYAQTIGVRWNPKVNRYQSLDRNYENFLGEAPALEKIQSYLR